MSKPLLLDTFCGAGGCTKGYQDAGFYVVGVDINPQPHYVGDEFFQGDALEFIERRGREFDVVHASPPCQAYSTMSNCHPENQYPDLIDAVRSAILKTSLPYIIENVSGARAKLYAPIMLCGKTFGLKVYRHRYFETRPFFLAPSHQMHRDNTPKASHGRVSSKGFISVAGGGGMSDYKRFAMDIDWMTRDELAQAIPPAYTEWIGLQLRERLQI